jgi:hypothetical protein
MDLVLMTPRCRLRVPSREDIAHLWTASRVPGFCEGMVWEPPEVIEGFDAPHENAIERWREQVAFTLTFESRNGGIFLGRISIRPDPHVPADWNIGFFCHL